MAALQIPTSVRRLFYYSAATAFTFLNFIAFLISRNNDWVRNPGQAWMFASTTEFRGYPASEFERTLSCYGLGQCQRIGGALVIQPLIFAGDQLSKFYFWNVDDTSRIFIIQMVSLGWRIGCVLTLACYIYYVSKKLSFVFFFINSLFFALSGWLLRIFGEVIEILPLQNSTEFKERSVLAFQDFPFENFKWYDFGLFLALPLISVFVSRLRNLNPSVLKILLFSIVLTSLFEYLGFVFALAWILFETTRSNSNVFSRQTIVRTSIIIFGSVIWLILITTYHRIMQSVFPKFFDLSAEQETAKQHFADIFWAIQHPLQNLTSNPSIPFQIFLVIFQCSVMGLALGFLARRIFNGLQIDRQTLFALRSVTIAAAVVMFVNFFVAYGVEIQAGEHARQTLGLQISLFTFLFLKTATTKSKSEISKSSGN